MHLLRRGIAIINRNSRHLSNMQTSSSSQTPAVTKNILGRIWALDRSSELSHLYTPLLILDCGKDASNLWVQVGYVETSFMNSTLLRCCDENDDPIFLHDSFMNHRGVTKDACLFRSDINIGDNHIDDEELFKSRTAILSNVTHQLLSLGISQKHSDMYPVSPFDEAKFGSHKQFALVNRSIAPYLGIDSVGVHLNCYVCHNENANKPIVHGVWLAKRAPTKSHHSNYWDPTVAGGQQAKLSLHENIVKEAHEEAGVPSEWLDSNTHQDKTVFTDHTSDPLTITTAKPDGSCLKRSIYYSFDLQVPIDWIPTAVDGEVSEFKLYSIQELEEELRCGNNIRPAMTSVLLDFMIRHDLWKENYEGELEELKNAMRRERMVLW